MQKFIIVDLGVAELSNQFFVGRRLVLSIGFTESSIGCIQVTNTLWIYVQLSGEFSIVFTYTK